MNSNGESNPTPEFSRRNLLVTAVGISLPAAFFASEQQSAQAQTPKTPVDLKRAEKFLRRAMELAQKGVDAGDGGPFGAVVVKGDEIIGEGWNHVVSNYDPTAHGEIYAIRDAGRKIKSFDLNGCELYTSGEPCPMCLAATYWARIERVFYGFSIAQAATIGFDDQYFYTELAKPMDKRNVIETQLLGEEGFNLLKSYAKNPARVKY